ncbi:hypothetical protein CEXT_547831 [Caerostris extrusa]|uniref:Uncharacterized protein n=1 Tax=Caerostris extrusa TaxID=172846 RepID=A0AAV4XLQ8_CAEEX|nr:hypothetical protein CEXT_547831 [Caerostris extrusa]
MFLIFKVCDNKQFVHPLFIPDFSVYVPLSPLPGQRKLKEYSLLSTKISPFFEHHSNKDSFIVGESTFDLFLLSVLPPPSRCLSFDRTVISVNKLSPDKLDGGSREDCVVLFGQSTEGVYSEKLLDVLSSLNSISNQEMQQWIFQQH